MTHETIAALRAAINQAYLADENEIVDELLTGLGTYDPNNSQWLRQNTG